MTIGVFRNEIDVDIAPSLQPLHVEPNVCPAHSLCCNPNGDAASIAPRFDFPHVKVQREGTDFGQSRFGHLDLTNFGQSNFGQSIFAQYLRCHGGPQRVGGQTQKKWGPEGWGPEGWGPEGWGPEGWGPEGWEAQHFAFFSISRHSFLLFFFSFGLFSWNFGGV